MTTADEFHPGDQTGPGYGDVSGIGADAVTEDAASGGEIGGGEKPQDESQYDEDPSADAAAEGDTDIYSNPGLELDGNTTASDGEDA